MTYGYHIQSMFATEHFCIISHLDPGGLARTTGGVIEWLVVGILYFRLDMANPGHDIQ
jgi:hypothetical protein